MTTGMARRNTTTHPSYAVLRRAPRPTRSSNRISWWSLFLVLSFLLHPATICHAAMRECVQTVRLRCDDPPCETPYMHSDFCLHHGTSCGTATPEQEQQHPAATAAPDACSFVAHALYVDFQLFDVVLLPANACQSDIRRGPFTKSDLQRLLPENSNEPMVAIRISGQTLLDNLQLSWEQQQQQQDSGVGGAAAHQPKTAGIRYQVVDVEDGRSDHKNNKSVRIKEPEILSSSCHWEAVDVNKQYKILTTQSVAEGGGGDGEFENTFVDERYHQNVNKAPNASIIKGAFLRNKFWFYITSVCNVRNPFRKPKQSRIPQTPQKLLRISEGETVPIFGQNKEYIENNNHNNFRRRNVTAVM